jgi:hypothetical protein
MLTPVYTPTRTDERNVSGRHVFFGGISVYLEQHAPVFRHTPRLLDRLWDSDWALRLATKRQFKVDPKQLGELTVSMLRGERGFQRKEISKLLDWLVSEPRFDVINLPYSLLLGLAEPLRRTLKVPICCTLQGEDLFLDGLGDPYRQQSLDLIREASAHVDAFLPVSRYYLDFMPGYLGVPRSKMRLAPLGMSVPATYAEPKGIFLLEAMAAGVPVVQPRRGAFPEILEATGGGLLVEADNPEALADGIRTLWQDPARAEALGRAGAAGVRQHYSVGQMAERVEQIYGEVIRGLPPKGGSHTDV